MNEEQHESAAKKFGLLSNQGISGSIPPEAENTESLSQTYFSGKAPLEVLVKSWLTSSVEDWKSFSSRDDMGCTEHSSTCSTEIDDPLMRRVDSL